MADDRIVVIMDDSEIVTDFFLTTCLQQPSVHNVWAAVACSHIDAVHKCVDGDTKNIRIIIGSTAELNIRPMLSCIGDTDIMFHYSTLLAIPANCPPPISLPAEFHGQVKVFEIIDSKFPGYVFLKLRYLLTECRDTGKYHAQHVRISHAYLSHTICNSPTSSREFHGPAHTVKPGGIVSSTDNVFCVRCLLWPPQATDWPTRHRYYGWPDSATLDRVVSNGCDVVRVAHRRYRKHEVAEKKQSRLSFS